MQVGPGQSAVHHHGPQARHKSLCAAQDVAGHGSVNGRRAAHRGAVKRGAQAVEVDAPAAVVARRTRHVQRGVKHVHIAHGNAGLVGQALAREGFPQTAQHADVPPIGCALDLRQQPRGCDVRQGLHQKLQVGAFVFQGKEQVLQHVAAARRHLRWHSQFVGRGQHPCHGPNGGWALHGKARQAQQLMHKGVANGGHDFCQ